MEGKRLESTFWDRSQLNREGYKIQGPAVVSEMDANTLILPGFVGEIDHVGNILISPVSESVLAGPGLKDHSEESAAAFIKESPMIPT